MKKVLILMLVLGLVSTANAYVVQLETASTGSISGNTGLIAGQELVVGDQIKLKITVTDLDNYIGSPAYDGYMISTLGVKIATDESTGFF